MQLFEFNEALPRLQVLKKKTFRNQRTSGSGFRKKEEERQIKKNKSESKNPQF